MRILFWNQEYAPSLGGVEMQTRNLATHLLAQGHEVAVATGLSAPTLKAVEVMDGVAVHRFPFYDALASREPATIRFVLEGVTLLKRSFRPDVVHVNFTDASPFFHLRTDDGTPTLVAFHYALDQWPTSVALARKVADRAFVRVCPSEFLAGNVGSAIGAIRPFTVVPNGVREAALLAVPALSGLSPWFLFAGRLVPLKGADVAIRAIAILAERGLTVGLRLAGAGPARASLRKLAEELGLADKVVFLGILNEEELARNLETVTALVAPSLSQEAFSQVAAEAAFAARPVIASRRGALVQTILDGETGLHFEPGNAEALADAMERILTTPDLASRLGNAGRLRAEKFFRFSTMALRYEQLYVEGVAGGTRSSDASR